MKKISLIVPCYNEQEALPIFHREVTSVLQGLSDKYDYELIYVNDGSADKTLEVLKGLAESDKKATYLSFSRNFGKEAAMYAGFTNAKGDFVSRKTYTPKSFYDEFVGADLEHNYVMVMNDPCREYNKVYEIDYDRHVYDGDNWVYLNLPIERIKEMAIASIKDDTAMYFSCDVGKFLDRSTGMLDPDRFDYESLFGVSFGMDKKERVQTHASGSSHAMTLIAVDMDGDKPVKWMVENSWGADNGYKGNLIMTDRWFDEYMFRLVVEKKYVPAVILGLLDQEPIRLPAWDPMFLPEE